MLLLSLNKPLCVAMNRSPLHVIILSLVLPVYVQAAEWSITGDVKQNLSYDDNVFLRSDSDRKGSFEYRIIPTMNFLHKTDVSEVQASASYGTQVYSNPAFNSLNQDIQNYGLAGFYKTERIDWGLNWNYSITPTRNNAQADSGNFDATASSDRWTVSPSATYKISELDSLSLVPSYSESSFSKGDGTGFRNYETKNVNLTWQHLWSERYSSSLSAFYSNFLSQSGIASDFGGTQQITYDSLGLNATNAYRWSDNWNLSGTIGFRETESEVNAQKSSSFGFLANATIDYINETYSGGINFSRSLAPSNQGFLQEQTSVGLSANYRLTDHLSAGLTTSYLISDQVSVNNQKTRENINVSPSISWNFSPDWTLMGSYRYRSQDRSSSGSSGIGILNNGFASGYSDLFMLSIDYNWQGFKASR